MTLLDGKIIDITIHTMIIDMITGIMIADGDTMVKQMAHMVI